jgi:formyltetrahydrofolate deformylase
VRQTATLLITCKDQKGLVYRLADFVFRHQGNILHADHHIDFETGLFLSRVEWDLDSFRVPPDEIGRTFRPLAEELEMRWELRFSDRPLRTAVFVSRLDHCLVDLLHRRAIGELPTDIVAVVSNHAELQPIADRYQIPFHVFPITAASKAAQEERELALLDALKVDLVVLARYMQVLTPEFVARRPNRIINIHHSFLPAFIGAAPYRRAKERGVKLVGATAHYVTEELDDGPIIEQDVVRVDHRHSVTDLMRLGADVERLVLSRAVLWHCEDRIIRFGNQTVVF